MESRQKADFLSTHLHFIMMPTFLYSYAMMLLVT